MKEAGELNRCQKSQGQKILRCFPHCCPRHIHYRNCGCSLSLHVQTITTCTPTAITTIDGTTAAAPSGAHDNGRILVAYAKFSQLEEDVDWAVGDSVPSSAVLDDLRSRGTPFRTWIPGHVEWTEANMWSFQFDEKKGDGWHYGWKSGRSRTQRTSAHVLKAFVFDPSGTTQRRDQWRVVGVASSTPFTITSYRGEHNKKQKRTSSNSAKRTSTTRPLQHLDPSSVPSTSGTSSDEGDDQADRPPDVDENGAVVRRRKVPSSGYITTSAIACSSHPLSHTTPSAAPPPIPLDLMHRQPTPPSIPEHQDDLAQLFGLLHVLQTGDFPTALWAPFEKSWLAPKGIHLNGQRLLLPHNPRHQTPQSQFPSSGTSPHHLEVALALISSLRDVSGRVQATLIRYGDAVLDKQCALHLFADCMGILQAQRPHGLRVLPTGESCLAGTLAIDYIGQVSEQLMRVELYAFSLTHVHVVCVQVVPQRGSGNGIELSCRVGIDEVSRGDEEVGLADEASMDSVSRIAWAKQLPQRTQVVQLMATYERVPGRI
ncbi:hypothetical protein DYB34_001841 [Aphanomyces astaci]|uniref:Uncharacterized protein n=1 Tax=Aphanomyces astaci TaxID=112090 RepID=A0A397ALP0_APHAT|nr:hypothetical protein DYB36_000354 [Aphanomyces astaci]RHY37234.1 hypothetical protein DYB34_001841 [Aphanomyces astaci]